MHLAVSLDITGAQTLKRQLEERSRDLSSVMKLAPSLIRKGPGSIAAQIAARAYFAEDGSVRPWQQPSGIPASSHPRVLAGEEIMWRAARGESAAGVTRTGALFAAVGVNDLLVRQEAARLGNQIVSSADYFGFVTGNFSERTSPAAAQPSKPIARLPGQRRRSPSGRASPKPQNLAAYTVQYAMWWFLGYTYGIWLTEGQLRAGVMTPPKNIGWNPILIERIRDQVADYIVGPDFTARGRANDPGRV